MAVPRRRPPGGAAPLAALPQNAESMTDVRPVPPPAAGDHDDDRRDRGAVLLTGATGLLGRYLVRDLAAAGVPLAVLVRPSGRKTAADRVAALLDDWQARTGRRPAAPKVLPGDLHADGLGLSAGDRAWVADHCGAVLHNAASLAFQTGHDGEPFASNVGGTEKVLDLCRDAGVRTFHHVSTAYVAGLRTGVVMEADRDAGQTPANVYEESKLQAERLVEAARDVGDLDVTTCLRPSIIVGDSRTGFTTTFHGFYAFLRVVHLIARAQRESGEAGTLRLTLAGQERKHFVPVDWVSAATAAVVADPAKHGGTYHLTPPAPISFEDMRTAVRAATGVGPISFEGSGAELDDPTDLERVFYEQTTLYSSYWRNDPTFDRTRTRRELPDLPCPNVTVPVLRRLADAAIAQGFRHRDAKPERLAKAA